MSKTLLEAAAEILKGSAAGAPKMGPEKLTGSEIQDLGGDTVTKHSTSKLEVGGSQATAPGKAPSSDTKAPSAKLAGSEAESIDPSEETEGDDTQEELEDKIEKGLKTAGLTEEAEEAAWKQELTEDVEAILAYETDLPKEFAAKIGTIYEARVTDKVLSITEALEAEYAEKFEAAVLEVRDSLTEQVNDYLNYVVEEWMTQNELAIEKGLRSELTEEFIGGLRDLFMEHYIDVPSEKVDLVDELATKVEELTSELNEEVAKSVELKKQLGESKKTEILNGICEGLTQTQVEKVRTLAESVEYTAEGEYTSKVSTIRENYFPATTGKKSNANAKMLTEASEVAEEKAPVIDAGVASVVAALTRTQG